MQNMHTPHRGKTTTRWMHDLVPRDVWAAAILQMLDVSDLARLAKANRAAAKDLPVGAEFVAGRTLDAAELRWFAARGVRVILATSSFSTGKTNKSHYWLRNGKMHRDGDLPAVDLGWGQIKWWWCHHETVMHQNKKLCTGYGDRQWYQDGKLHRDGDLPAIECFNGRREWRRHGNLHRDGDMPALEWRGSDGRVSRYWFQNGHLHRDGDRPAVERADGGREWRWHGNLHREGGRPAIVYAGGGQSVWCVHGERVGKPI